MFRNGKIVESYSFGIDYTEEMAEVFEDAGELPEELDHGIPWDINVTDNQQDQFLFCSTLRSVLEDEIKNSESFLNGFFISHDAWLPDWQSIPWVSVGQPPEMLRSDFVRVDLIEPAF